MLKNIFSRILAVVAVVGLVAVTGCKDNAEPKAEITSVSYNSSTNLVTISGKNFGTSSDDVVILFNYAGGAPVRAAEWAKSANAIIMDGTTYQAFSPASVSNETITVTPGCFYGNYNVKLLVKQMAADAPAAVEVNNCL